MEYLINGIRGFCMALADSVPGVSGGTIAFILGFYDKFINSLDRLKDLIACFPRSDNTMTSSISLVPVCTFLYISKKYVLRIMKSTRFSNQSPLSFAVSLLLSNGFFNYPTIF